MRRKEERSKQGQTNNKGRQHSTPKAVTFPKKNELPRVGLEPTTLYTLDRALYHRATKAAQLAGPMYMQHLIVQAWDTPGGPGVQACIYILI